MISETQDESSSPVSLLVASLSQIEPEHQRGALRIGYLKAIKTLVDLIGDENVMVLSMISFYSKFFATRHLARQTLIAKFEYVWHQTHREISHDNNVSTASINVGFQFAYAAYYVVDAPYVAFGMAGRLRDAAVGHEDLVGFATWGLAAEAFVFASRVIAELYRQRVGKSGPLESTGDEYGKCCATLQGAIMLLANGDLECRIRAARFSRILNRWLMEWGMAQEAHDESLRSRQIEDSIPGKACRRCLRERYCNICSARALRTDLSLGAIEADRLIAGSQCGRCKPERSSRLCQRCWFRQGTVGWKPKGKYSIATQVLRPCN